MDLVRELLTAEIHVVSSSSTQRGSIPEASNFPTAFAAAYIISSNHSQGKVQYLSQKQLHQQLLFQEDLQVSTSLP